MLTGTGRKINPKQPGEKPVRYFSGPACCNPAVLLLSGSEGPKHLVTVSHSGEASWLLHSFIM